MSRTIVNVPQPYSCTFTHFLLFHFSPFSWACAISQCNPAHRPFLVPLPLLVTNQLSQTLLLTNVSGGCTGTWTQTVAQLVQSITGRWEWRGGSVSGQAQTPI